MSEKEVKMSSEERLENLTQQLEEVAIKREQLNSELQTLNILFLKIQGAIEVLTELTEDDEVKKEDKK